MALIMYFSYVVYSNFMVDSVFVICVMYYSVITSKNKSTVMNCLCSILSLFMSPDVVPT